MTQDEILNRNAEEIRHLIQIALTYRCLKETNLPRPIEDMCDVLIATHKREMTAITQILAERWKDDESRPQYSKDAYCESIDVTMAQAQKIMTDPNFTWAEPTPSETLNKE